MLHSACTLLQCLFGINVLPHGNSVKVIVAGLCRNQEHLVRSWRQDGIERQAQEGTSDVLVDFDGRPGLLDAPLLSFPTAVQTHVDLLDCGQALGDVVVNQVKKGLQFLTAVENLQDT